MACVRLLAHLRNKERPEAQGSDGDPSDAAPSRAAVGAIAVLGVDRDVYAALDAAGVPSILLQARPDQPPPSEWLTAATPTGVAVTGADATRRIEYLKASCGLAGARLWAPPGGKPADAETFAAALPGALAVDLVPAEVRGRLAAAGRARRATRQAAAILVGAIAVGGLTVGAAEAYRRRAADRLRTAETERQALSGSLASLAGDVAALERDLTREEEPDHRPAPVGPLLAAVIEATPRGVLLTDVSIGVDATRAPAGTYAALRPAGTTTAIGSPTLVVGGRAPALDDMKRYREALSAHPAVAGERLRRADVTPADVRFEIEVEGAVPR